MFVGTPTWHYIPSSVCLTVMAALRHSLHLCLYTNPAALFRAPASRTNSSGHAYPSTPNTLWQSRLANRNPHKERLPFRPKFIQPSHQQESSSRYVKWTWPLRRKTLHPAAQPRCLVNQALHHSTEHTAQQYSAPQLYQSQPLRFTQDPWPTNRTSGHTPTQSPTGLHFTAALFSDHSQHRWGRPSNIHS